MLLLVGCFVLAPLSTAIFRSFFAWNPGYASPFVGFRNYGVVFHSPAFAQIVKNEAIFMLGVPLWAGMPLFIALLLYERVPFAGFFRAMFLIPTALSPVIMGILFRSILRPDGILNSTLKSSGLGFLAHDWIDSPSLVKPVIILVVIWYTLGFGVLLYSAALSAVPVEIFEAAEIDGASWFRRLIHIMLPAIRPMFVLNLIFNVATVFLLFGYVYVLTQGGPGYASTTLDWDIYENAFQNGNFGVAAAESALLLGVMLVVLTLTALASRRYNRQ